jgi:7-carboxy-7-deazaguanine synthase (Cx14CxxC type)
MGYAVKELFFTLQGEGAHTGRPAVFCRFSGCNLWNGREPDRASASCAFCDTDFVGVDGPGGGRFGSAEQLAAAATDCWPGGAPKPGDGAWVVCTGGEPTLQLDDALIAAFHAAGFEVAIETNGTRAVPMGVDWVCVSPKVGAAVVQRHGDELKVVFPQPGLDLDALKLLDFGNFYVQPMDGPNVHANTAAAVRYCLEHPPWRLSLQTHKVIGLP